jgi:hypothetical protein
MPLPGVKLNESKQDYINRCMSNSLMKSEYPDSKQRLAICYNIYEKETKMDDTTTTNNYDDGWYKIQVEQKLPIDEIQFIVISSYLGIEAMYSLNRKKILEYYFNFDNSNYTWTEDEAINWYNESRGLEGQDEAQAKRFFKKDMEKKIVYGVALVPWEVDLVGDIEAPEDVEQAAHSFMKSLQVIGEMHKKFKGIGTVLESYIAPVDFEMNGVKVKEGSWVLVTEASDTAWDKIKNEDLVGYSIGYSGRREPIEV